MKCTLECGAEDALLIDPPTSKWGIYLCRNCAREVAKVWATHAGPVWAISKRHELEKAKEPTE